MVRGIVTINNITFSNGSQYIIVEEEVGLWDLWLFKTVYETTESEQNRNPCFTVKMMTWPCSYIFFYDMFTVCVGFLHVVSRLLKAFPIIQIPRTKLAKIPSLRI